MVMIQSHQYPYKSLKQHVGEVHKASMAILGSHSEDVRKQVDDCMNYTIQFHDLGKAIPEFQKYIKNPQQYSNQKKYKAHTPVSLILWLLYAQKNHIPNNIILLVSATVWKHHGDFPSLNTMLNESLYEYEDDYKISKYPINQVIHELTIELSNPFEADEFDIQNLIDDTFFENWQIEKAAGYKIKGLLLFSILLEADRTFLALSEYHLKQKLNPMKPITISPEIVDGFLSQKSKSKKQNIKLNRLRTDLRYAIINDSDDIPNIESVTLPTGLGKTMVAAHWALKHRNQAKIARKVIIVLPYLSIIDQTVKEYQNLLEKFDPSSLILEAHSIADRKYVEDSNENQNNKFNDAIDFLADTWSADFVITTFDQFLYTLLSSKNSHLLRFHNLADALIIIDEIQALPSKLWEPLSVALLAISKTINSKVLVMSATQPEFLQARELVSSPDIIFNRQCRYQLLLKHISPINLKTFINDCIRRIDDEDWHLKRVMIVLNTRKSARTVLDSLEGKISCNIFFLSADVTPKERLATILKIKENKPCLVITTQCIEAGVDIDMDFAIRDFAPLDSIVQCAGRCNRNGLKNRADIDIVSLTNENGKKYAGFIYDKTLLEKTSMILTGRSSIHEEDIYQVMKKYFQEIRNSKDTGKIIAGRWAFWRDELNIKKLLRNESAKYCFIVTSQDQPKNDELPLKDSILSAIKTESIWDRKRKIRSLQSRISELTICVWANSNIIPEEIAEPIGCYYLLKDGYYIPGKGINIEDNNVSCKFF
ncbi:CRISPR-associated helicase/endonuclease Cas3 [Desulfosarcina ovata subsp. sediminis]|uniref:CRISPR-associated helicase/endonuclease Cas3 n=1 Tax=Desulfosarcina ovata subsp. sediminis TaxID=885957 RepID=A0A5K7ZQP3_9BACT|nr:CRISPR-associated helicase Cas3' [Desulfosarcina ovata]BBO82130.1 CRISPR-associated helicase/endonuclease Cas3 [Desulfosarcina ovata subsp. sediminis]